ncbi:hypothetical protein [Ruegeria faecimaris]|uniref:hypothetical protein n=1 Tax=Ruegeria faecimaris TaxID=686389 RepID=UPI0024925610|nr:hypothetical protein [Ruegeria faecimaris]
MNRLMLGLVFVASTVCGHVSAQEWVYLGGRPAGEMDTSSIMEKGGLLHLNVRIIADQPQGRMFLNQALAVDCSEGWAWISDGWITSSFSSKVAPMPDLPEHQRIIHLPAPNEAYNNMYHYICGL